MRKQTKTVEKSPIILCDDDMQRVAVITEDGKRGPTKWEVVHTAYLLLRYPSNGKGLAMKILASAMKMLWAAPWKAPQASWENDDLTTPEAPMAENVTR